MYRTSSLHDLKTSQHKNYTEAELRRAKIMLEAAIAVRKHLTEPPPPRSTRRRKPRLNVVFNVSQCVWSIGAGCGLDGRMDKLMQISCWAIITIDADEPLALLEAYPEGTEQELSSFRHTLPPRRPTRMMVSAFVLPIIGTVRETLQTGFIIRNQYGRSYWTSKAKFRWASSGIENRPD